MFKYGEIAFGDNVRIANAESTRQSGHAELMGQCFGMTTPSVTGVEVIGDSSDDVALNVHFEDDAVADGWFAPGLVMLVDRAVGSIATVGEESFVKTADGSWVPKPAAHGSRPRKRWFRRS